VVPIVPLVDCYGGKIFINGHDDVYGVQLPETWILLILSGILFLLGSIFFIRSFEYPTIEPLFKNTSCVHFSSDDLVAAYCFYIGSLLLIPISVVYIVQDPTEISYWAAFIAATLFMIGSAFFVYCCYPTSYTEPFFFPILVKCFRNPNIIKFLEIHCCNDWLVTTWLFLFASLLWSIGSILMLIYIVLWHSSNSKEIYLYSSSIFDSILFLIGSMYFCAGSYHLDVLTTNNNNSLRSQQTDSDIDICFEHKTENAITEKLIRHESTALI